MATARCEAPRRTVDPVSRDVPSLRKLLHRLCEFIDLLLNWRDEALEPICDVNGIRRRVPLRANALQGRTQLRGVE